MVEGTVPVWRASQSGDPYSGWRGLPRRARRLLGRCRALLRLSESTAALSAAQIGSCLDTLEQAGAAIHGELATLRAQMAQSEQHQSAIRAELRQLRAQIGPDAFAGLREELVHVSERIARIAEQNRSTLNGELHVVGQQIRRLSAENSETKQRLDDLGETTSSQLQSLANIAAEARDIGNHVNTSVHTRLNTIENVRIRDLYNQMQDLAASLMRIRADGRTRANVEPIDEKTRSIGRLSTDRFDVYLKRARREFHGVFHMWQERLDATLKAFSTTKIGNVAVAGDPPSELFRCFVRLYASGRVLDVGCGVFGCPYYLSYYPASLISGLDPLPPVEPPDFEFVRGIQEYLPWPDQSFSTVISATSLDHCISLDRSLAEIRRVLRADGRFLLWIDSVPGSPPFTPEAPDFAPADQFHLFHFDMEWFEPMLAQWFEVEDRFQLRGLDFSRIMYCLKLRRA
jgi:SAM-dependent methyltransferase